MARGGRLVVLGLAIPLAILAGVKISRAGPAPPAGIAAQNWRPLTEDVGIALQSDRGQKGQGPVFGTLMVRDGDRWRTVELMTFPRPVPAK